MEIILLEKVANLGNLGDRVNVRSGYGRNYLIPQGKAVVATAAKLAEFEKRRADLEKDLAEKTTAAQARAEAISKLNITIRRKAGDEGRLFGSVSAKDIADAVTEAGVEVMKHEVPLPAGAIRQTGDYEIMLRLHGDVTASLALTVVAE